MTQPISNANSLEAQALAYINANSLEAQALAYINRMPENTMEVAGKAFTFSLLFVGLVSGSATIALGVAAMDTVATVVHGLISPMFKDMLNGRTVLKFEEECLRTGFAIGITGVLAAAMGVRQVLYGFLSNVVFTMAFNSIFNKLLSLDHTSEGYDPSAFFDVNRANGIILLRTYH